MNPKILYGPYSFVFRILLVRLDMSQHEYKTEDTGPQVRNADLGCCRHQVGYFFA